jgi:DNA helicase II / ATP-dependent DNA helicase PcrA
MLEWIEPGPPADKIEFFESNRNLFYVACSRPKIRLALLITQLLSQRALERLIAWFGPDNVIALPSNPETA